MSSPSNWPLPPESFRFLVPLKVQVALSEHPISRGMYPTSMGYYSRALNHEMRRIVHDDNLLIYCIEGGGVVTVEGVTNTIHAGDMFLLCDGVSHSYRALNSNPWTIYWVHFTGTDSRTFIEYLQAEHQRGSQVQFSIGVKARLVTEIEALMEVRESSSNLSSLLYASSRLRQILSYIALLSPAAHQQRNGLDLEQVHSLMQSHIHEHLSLEKLSNSVNMSKYHFIKRYKELTGTTPIDQFIHLKVERACHLLDSTIINIYEVASAVGYEDAYYFSRIFKKIKGVSPRQYRQMRTGLTKRDYESS
ncbi:MmsAB operon regulatory protein [Vibrio nigripulchritudo SFn27]|uniref:MmsAB operon regulatory protein n=1 Tax=Vibrio nigripulchritudo TaxID=28173 RepID=U4KA61_9VIBR|nr:AraC family transcriptional regulator [Vibrio nigripulchritudo]CCN83825.1 MmsAB operon regulatory protein [Vibrio nigripulchritudo BLFn1]CCN87167.1 MmsAB operon regulatory protein [Vibrio nigripulchritudo SFn27]CCN94523.1 MmsAB operon regulatory protein [Vibrio nigripulchritudo ENn2]CCO40911.1 MmsAB operon regulatory protein [Vibrio nigripulchritudo SFn135]CCO54990.1 MmsAB operon regulatory protein [Vibrio nigripulchritudo Wn13]